MNEEIPQDFFNKNLDNIIDGKGKMMDRLGFFPTSLWKPDIKITKILKKQIDDKSQVRKSLNAHRSDRRNGVNGAKPSVFNPQLAQMILAGYCKPNSKIFDAFGGGGTRGYIATKMGHDYTGVEIREEEIIRIKKMFDIWGFEFKIELGDSRKYTPQRDYYDFAFTCPPYYDLEQYSNINGDLSNYKTYDEFLIELEKVIINNNIGLKKDSLSVWVVGNFRDRKGNLKHLNGDLIRLAEKNGFKLWDEIIWQGASNVALTRCGKFEVNRKSVRMHEYVIILKKVYETIPNDALHESKDDINVKEEKGVENE